MLSNRNSSEFKVKSPPEDGITRIRFGPNSAQFLLVSSWDSSVRLYDVLNNTLRTRYSHGINGSNLPVFDCCFQDPIHVWSGGLDNALKAFDINSGTETVVGSHDNAVRCVEFSSEVNCVVTGGWDGQVKLWDPRTNQCTGSHTQPGKVYSMSLAGEKLIVGTANRKV
jgi:cell cycle arrest protein BUB3